MKEQFDNTGKVIAKINNRQGKFVIYFDTGEKIELNEISYLSCGYLYSGKQIDINTLEEMIHLTKLQEGINYINNLLARNLYTSHELIHKLQNTKNYDYSDAEKIVTIFIDNGRINDKDYAIDLLDDLKEKGKSKEYAYQKMISKMFNYDLIKSLLEDYEENDEAVFALIENCSKRYASKPYDAKKKAIYNYLISKGFSHEKSHEYVDKYYDINGGKNEDKEAAILHSAADRAYQSAMSRGKNSYDSKQKFIRYLLTKGFKYNDILELLEGGEYEFD